MRHIINFVGFFFEKSTVLKELGFLLPDYEVLVIDDFVRRYGVHTPETEEKAWRELWLAALQADYCLIESSGKSENLQMVLDRLWRAPGTNIVTLEWEAPTKTKRLLPHQIAEILFRQLPSDFH